MFNGPVQREEILFSFLRAGLADGDKCVVVLEEEDPVAALEPLGDATVVEEWRADGRLDVRGAEPAPDGGDGLTVEQMLALWADAFAAAAEGSPFDFVRVTGDATWWTPQTDEDTLVRYESELTAAIPERVSVLCLYDVARLSGPVLVDTVRAHPRLLVGSVVIENPFFLPPAALDEVRHGSTPVAGPTDHDIRQLANLARIDMSRPATEFDCDCGATLYASAERDEGRPPPQVEHVTATSPYPALYLVCPYCGAAWMREADGVVAKRSDRID